MSQRKFGDEFIGYFNDNNKICSYCAEDSEYIEYIENELEKARKRPGRIFIYVKGGRIQDITADGHMDILALDGDTDGIDYVDKYTDIGGDKFKARQAWESHPDNNKKIVDHYFEEQKRVDEENDD